MGKKRKKLLCTVLTGVMMLSLCQSASATNNSKTNEIFKLGENDLKMWYTKPASEGAANLTEDNIWQEYTLPIGNGDIGGNVYGEIVNERITFNEKTLWTGGPSEKRPDYNGGNKEMANNGKAMSEVLKEIQELFALHTEEGNRQASDLCNQLVGISSGYGAYQAWGEIKLDFRGITRNNVNNYTRDLDLRTGISSVNYVQGDTEYTREYFVSHPDNVMVIRIEAKGSDKLNFDISFPSKQNAITEVKDNTITLKGEVADNQMKYNSKLKVVSDNGTVIEDSNKLTVEDATAATIYISAATDYKNDYPIYRTGESDEDLDKRVEEIIKSVYNKKYEDVKAAHVADYKNIFDRVDLDLGQELPSIPTDELLTGYGNNAISESARRALEVMLFQYGRYLTISSSREDSQLPANLQGVWNNRNNPPWSSDYHMNVNLQMNYWPTYSTNMTECATPLVNYIESLREPGRETARIYAGVESYKDENGEYIEANGFMAHTQNTPFGWTCPGWSFDWGWSPAAVPWILQNVWEMYEYTGNVEYMRDVIYPIMKEEVTLYENMLIWDEVQQRMVSSPTYSPEHGPRTVGNTYEQTLIYQLYDDTIKAAEILGTDADLVKQWKDTQSKLDPIQIGDDGQIKEWYEETTLNSIPSEGYGHRHMSHLLGLFPGDFISVETPELLEAALVSLRNRTDASTGWGMGQRINTWARAGQGNKALELITKQLRRVGTGLNSGGGTYSNLWDAHAPFQIDGNFGATSGIAEMLMQSNMGYVYFLPALPDAWADGSYEGLLARGNFEVGAKWSNGKAYEFNIKSNNGGECVVRYDNLNLATVTNTKGEKVEFTVVDEDKISFNSEVGESYRITDIPVDSEALDAPTGLVAERLLADSVELNWDAMEGESVSYNVYRQINKGDVIAVAKNITETSFEDKNAEDILGTFTYKVSAVVNGKETKVSEGVGVSDLRNMAGYIDDRDSRIVYSGKWGDWSEAPNYGETIKFLENPVGNETATLTFVGTGIELITCTNHDRGKLEITIDGVVQGEVDTYSPSTVRQKTIYSKNDLEYGKHTIVVRATNTKSDLASRTKVEIDAFKVLDSKSQRPTEILVSSKSGITNISKENSSVQMVATVLPSEISNKEVTWSVSDSNIATIDEDGILTTKNVNGNVIVTATSKEDTSISGSITIKVAIPTMTFDDVIVEDGYMDNTKNPDITWDGSWSVWNGESSRHHGGTKTEAKTGAAITYTFTGTEIEVYAQKHENFSSFDISIDNEKQGNFSLAGSSTGDDQALVAAFKDLGEGEHTIHMVAVDRAGKVQVNLDYFKVFKPVTSEIVDKSALQSEIEEQSNKAEPNYTVETWDEFKVAYENAVNVMNNDNSTETDVADALANLKQKAAELVGQEAPGPVIPEEAKVTAIGVESKTLMLTWPQIDGAVKYEVYLGAVKIGETSNNFFRVSELTPNTDYRFVVKAVSEVGKTTAFNEYNVKTALAADTERPSNIDNINVKVISETSAEISWSEASDNIGVASYKVYLNGILKAEVEGLSYVLEDLDKDTKYIVRVVAVDAVGNTSLIPVSKGFTIGNNDNKVDKSALQALVDESTKLLKDDYTAESWMLLENALDSAQNALANENATQEEVDLALNQLQTAKDGLVEKEPEVNLFFKHLGLAVEIATSVTEESLEGVVPAVKKEFKDALSEAQGILADIEAGKTITQDQVDKSFERLSKAMHMLEFKGDRTQFLHLVDEINALDSSKFTVASWNGLQEVLNSKEVQEVINNENALQADIDKVYRSLVDAYNNLELVPQVNKDKLNELIDKVGNLDDKEYIASTWKKLIKALEIAKNVSANVDATKEQVDKAYEDLLGAYLNLRLKPSKDKLEDLINKAESLDPSKYTAKSYKTVEKALKTARKVYEDEKVTAEDIAKAEKSLEVAMANLEVKDSGSGNNGGGEGMGNNGGNLPQTGGTSAVVVGLLGLTAAGVGVKLIRKRK